MDERAEPVTPPAGLQRPPAVRSGAVPAPWRSAWDAPPPGGPGTRGTWRGLRERGAQPLWRWSIRSRRIAVGVGIAATVLALLPFTTWSWPLLVTWGAGVGVLLLLRLLGLGRALQPWMGHLLGLVVIAGMAQSAGPLTTTFAAGVGVLLTGAARLPSWWWVAAAGVLVCAVSGTGLVIVDYRTADQVAAQQAQASLENRGQLGAARPTALLPALLNEIARGETGLVCSVLIAAPARPAFAAAAGQPDCPAAVRALAAQVRDRSQYAKAQAPGTDAGDVREVDACRMTWRGAPAPLGPQLGHLTVGRIEGGATWVVTGFGPC